MDSKLSKYGIDKIQVAEFGEVDINEFISKLKTYNVKIIAIIPFQRGTEFARYILENLKIDLEGDIIYPEDSSGIIYDYKGQIVFGDYKYLVVFEGRDGQYNEDIYWFHAYKYLGNIGKELKFLEEEQCL